MDVEVDLYSGRPNPVFRLDQAQADDIVRRLGDLAPLPLSGGRGVRDVLGYRGLRLLGLAPGGGDVVVSNGVVVLLDPSGAVRGRLEDRQRSLERRLIELGQPALGQDVLTYLRADLVRNGDGDHTGDGER